MTPSAIIEIVGRMGFPSNTVVTYTHYDDSHVGFLMEQLWPDKRDPSRKVAIGKHFMIPTHAPDRNHVIAEVRQHLIETYIHEVDEWLAFDGEQLTDPHEGEEML